MSVSGFTCLVQTQLSPILKCHYYYYIIVNDSWWQKFTHRIVAVKVCTKTGPEITIKLQYITCDGKNVHE